MIAHYGASITLIGAKTAVHHNCTKGRSWNYGLQVRGFSSSTIQLVSPLTKEIVSTNNGGGGNWGAKCGADIDEIKQIEPNDAAAASVSASTAETMTGETKSIH